MKQFLTEYLLIKESINPKYYDIQYMENTNIDALSDDFLNNGTSWIYKVGVLIATDSNKCDFAHVVIASMKNKDSVPVIKGHFYFENGENDDMGRTIDRAFNLLKCMHPAFNAD